MPSRKGSRNKANKWRELKIAEAGQTPLGYMLDTLNDPEATKADKQWAAQHAAPYVHPRLSATQVQAEITTDPLKALYESVVQNQKPLIRAVNDIPSH